jgi:putative FmdB family regulatory protein
MPFYSYKCKDCGTLIEEVYQNITDEPLKECPECKGELVRLIGGCNFILKGGGWPGKDIKGENNGKRT